MNKYRNAGTDCYYKYLVTLTFYDKYGVERTAKNQRMIYLDSSDFSTLDTICDTITFGNDDYNQPIKPVSIRIEFNADQNDNQLAHYVGVMGLTYVKSGTQNVFTSKDYTGSSAVASTDVSDFTSVDNTYVDGVSLVPATAANPNLWKLSTINDDHWSKQLWVQVGAEQVSYHFIYKRNGVYQSNWLMEGSGKREGGKLKGKASILATENTMENRVDVYKYLDKNLLTFLKDETGQPNNKFVDE